MHYKTIFSMVALFSSCGALYGMEREINELDQEVQIPTVQQKIKSFLDATKSEAMDTSQFYELKKRALKEMMQLKPGRSGHNNLFAQKKLFIAASKNLKEVFGTNWDGKIAIYDGKTGVQKREWDFQAYLRSNKFIKRHGSCHTYGCALDDSATRCAFYYLHSEPFFSGIGILDTKDECNSGFLFDDNSFFGEPALSHDGKKVAWWHWKSESNKGLGWVIEITEWNTGREVLSAVQEDGSVEQLFSPNDELIAFCLTSPDGLAIHVLKVEDGTNFQKINVTDYGFAFSPDSEQLLGVDQCLKIWNIQDGKEVLALLDKDTPQSVVAWLDAHTVAALYKDAAHDEIYHIKLYDLAKKVCVQSIQVPTEASPANTRLYFAQLLAEGNELMFVVSNDKGTTTTKWLMAKDDQKPTLASGTPSYCTIQ